LINVTQIERPFCYFKKFNNQLIDNYKFKDQQTYEKMYEKDLMQFNENT